MHSLRRWQIALLFLCVGGLAACRTRGEPCVVTACRPSQAPVGEPVSITAIDVLLEPDATLLRHAQANNARLRQVYEKGFALDATHNPHVTLVQRFVRTRDLEQVHAAAGRVLAAAKIGSLRLEAFKYYYAPTGDLGIAGIVIRPTPELLKLQQDVIDAVAPFTVPTGTIAAYTAPHDDPATDRDMIEYAATFVPTKSGANFNPHVSTGVAPRAYLDPMLAEPFEPFTSAPGGAAVYQLGPFGTAAKKLKGWTLDELK